MNQKPNILWICTDQQRYDTLGCYGNPLVKTPNIDRLAKTGVKFNNAYCQSPVCSPSRAGFLTGRYPSTTKCRQNGQIIAKDEKLISKIFAENGYNCGLAGKLHIAPCHPSVCKFTEERIDDGYTYFEWSHHIHAGNDITTMNWPNNAYHLWLSEQNQTFKVESYHGDPRVQIGMDEEFHPTTWSVNKAINFMKANNAFHVPWFFSLNIYDPHHAFDPPKDYLERYIKMLDEILLPNYVEGELENKPIFQQREFQNGAYNCSKVFKYNTMSEQEHKLVKAAYWAMCDLIDKQVGRLLQTLEEIGQLENTIIMFMSDHGEMLGDHGLYLKGPHFYDCAVKVPLIISWKHNFLENVERNALVELTDIAPTLMDAVNMKIYEGMQGVSMLDLLTHDNDVHRQDVMSEYMNSMQTHNNPKAFVTMLRNKHYKIVCAHGIDQGELYDMVNDPNETHNLWNHPSYAEVKTKLLKRLCDRIAFTCDPLPIRTAGY